MEGTYLAEKKEEEEEEEEEEGAEEEQKRQRELGNRRSLYVIGLCFQTLDDPFFLSPSSPFEHDIHGV